MNDTSTQIVRCPSCGAKNRVTEVKTGMVAKCGKCHSPLKADRGTGEAAGSFTLRCDQCGTRNRVPLNRINVEAKCGKCGSTLRTDELFSGEPFLVTDSNFEEKVLKSPLPVLVFAWAPWCPTCRSVMPTIDDFAKESKARVKVGKLNVDTNPMLSSKYDILSVPQLFIFDNGRLKENLPGALQKHEIMMKMAHYL